MKKIKFIILFILLLICCGCSYKYGSTTRAIRHSKFNMASQKFICNPVFDKEGIKDPIKFYVGNYLISEKGNIYEVNLGKVYSNDMNCRKNDFNHKVKAIYNLSVIKADDNKYYYIGDDEDIKPFTEVSENDEDYELYDMLLKDTGVLKVSTLNSKDLKFYVLKDDGNIYQYNITKTKEDNYLLDSTEMVYSKNSFDSKIEDFNYNGSSSTTFVKTTSNYYRMLVSNSEECNKYADISCKYEMRYDEKLTTVKNQILAYNGSALITTYGAIFNATD